MKLCYECHTTRTEIVKVAEDQQQLGLFAVQANDDDQAVACYRRAREILLTEPMLECKQHIPPLFCAATNEKTGWPDIKVWLPSIFGTYELKCERCGQKRPVIDCDHVKKAGLRRHQSLGSDVLDGNRKGVSRRHRRD